MPVRSFHLLPPEYLALTQGPLNKYFPNDFKVDLNGKTLAWEAIVLIPFVDEAEVLFEEKKLIEAGYKPTEADRFRNIAAFEIFSYKYRQNTENKFLRSTLTQLTSKVPDHSQVTLLKEYEDVGKFTFESKLHPKVKHPSPGYPSFKYLEVQELEADYKVV